MCGLAGTVGQDGPSVEKMLEFIVHRGPDSGGQWAEDGVHLGHRRLSILDLDERGSQPMASADGRWQLTLNGEIYNHLELKRELESLGHCFATRTDTEVLVAALQEWGVESISRLRGMFAIAAWDRGDQSLWLARDHFGKKPLFYRESPDQLAYCSELRCLRASFDLKPDPDALRQYFHWGYIPDPQTAYLGVSSLPAGSMACWKSGRGLEIRRFWSPGEYLRQNEDGAEEAEVDELDELVGRAVRRRLMSDVPLGAFLSGGMDSALVASYLCEAQPGSLCITVGFDVESQDESVAAAETAALIGAEHRIERVALPSAENLFDDFLSAFDQPFADGSAIPSLVLCQATRQHVTVALGGDGADELFGGYSRYRWYAKALSGLSIPAPMRRILASVLARSGQARHRRIANLLRSENAEALYAELLKVWHAGPLDALLLHKGTPASSTFFPNAGSTNPMRQAQTFDLENYLSGDILVKMDRASMAHSLETRAPFLDVDLAERILRSKSFGQTEQLGKPALQKLLRKRIPVGMGERPKKGFSLPQREWLRDPLAKRLAAVCDPVWLKEQGLFEPAEVGRIHRRFLAGDLGLHAPLWAFLCYQEWYLRHATGRPQ